MRVLLTVLLIAIGISVVVVILGLLMGVTDWRDHLPPVGVTLAFVAGIVASYLLLCLFLSAYDWQFSTIRITGDTLDEQGNLPRGFIPLNTEKRVWFGPDLGDVFIQGPIRTSSHMHISKGTTLRASEPIYARTITARIIVSSEPLQDYTRYHPNCGDIISSSTAVGDLNG